MIRRRFPVFLAAAVFLVTACADDTSVVTEPEATDGLVTSRVADESQRQVIPDQYIVVFKQDVASPGGLAQRLATQHGLELRHTYRNSPDLAC
jgi:hypothetical protein